MDDVEDLLHEVARRLVMWSEPTLPYKSLAPSHTNRSALTPRSAQSTQEMRMAAQCSFFDDDSDEQFLSANMLTNQVVTLPPVRGAPRRHKAPQSRRQYAELHGRDAWNWDHA